MKLLITTLTIIFINFGASANSEKFQILRGEHLAKDCVKAYEKGKLIQTVRSEIETVYLYLLAGRLYEFAINIYSGQIGSILEIRYCRSSNRIY